MVDPDYGARVEKGLTSSSFSEVISSLSQKLGLSHDMSSLVGEKSK